MRSVQFKTKLMPTRIQGAKQSIENDCCHKKGRANETNRRRTKNRE